MATGIFGGFYRGGHATAGPELTNTNAINTTTAIEILNNAAHVADCHAQVRVCVSDDEHRPDDDWAINVWNRVYSDEFEGLIRADGTPYPYRCRIGGWRDGGAGTVTFALVVTAPTMDAQIEIGRAGQNVITAQTTSGTNAWLTGAGGTGGGVLLQVDNIRAREAMEAVDAIDAVAGTAAPTQWCWLRCEVWARSTSLASEPVLTALSVAEYIGT